MRTITLVVGLLFLAAGLLLIATPLCSNGLVAVLVGIAGIMIGNTLLLDAALWRKPSPGREIENRS